MGYHDHDPPAGSGVTSAAMHAAPPRDWIATVVGLLGIVVRLIGIGLLVVGLMIGVEVVTEAWALYRDPGRIQVFADALEQGTRIDAMMRGLTSDESADAANSSLGVAFLLSWFIAPTLLFTAGYLAMAAVRTGGQLALGPARNS